MRQVLAAPDSDVIELLQRKPLNPSDARPRLLGLLNAPVEWGRATWATYIWDFVANETPRGRKELFLHELFHRVQPQLGLTVPAVASEHLAAVDGRYWLRLEWHALARALRESAEQRNTAVREALAFRQARRMLYQAARAGPPFSSGMPTNDSTH